MKSITLDPKTIFVHADPDAATAVCLFTGEHNDSYAEQVLAHVRTLASGLPLLLLTVPVSDWNADLSPWAFSFEDAVFAGNAPQTAAFLSDTLLPFIKQSYPQIAHIVTAGYSLAGLFAFWSVMAVPGLSGCVSASGSLWYPQLTQYLTEHMPHGKTIYLSLGGKEENTKIPYMKPVGDNTRAIYTALRKQSDIRAALEWNPGGHFRDGPLRVAKGIVWTLSHL